MFDKIFEKFIFKPLDEKKNYSENINVIFDQMIHAQISYSWLFSTYLQLVMLILLLTFVLFFYICKRPLAKLKFHSSKALKALKAKH